MDPSYIVPKVSNGNIYLNGNLKVNVLFENTDTLILDSKTYEVAVDDTINIGREIDEKYVDISIDVNKQNVSLINGNVETNIVLGVDIVIENVDKVVIVGEIEELPIDEENFTSMYMYIVKKGDTLWDIAKRYKTSVAKIVNINNIEDENKLQIGQRILIIR